MLKIFEEKKFNVPPLKGISGKTVEEHLKLYAGYVKNTNGILAKIEQYSADLEANGYSLAEIQRRFAFEFDGMRNHEYYFAHLENGSAALTANSALKRAIEAEWGHFDKWLDRFKAIALTRGIGWAVLYHDRQTNRLLNAWIDEQHLGHLTGLSPVLALDMWEHSYLFDYPPGEKKKYVEAFFENLNWQTCESNYLPGAPR